MSVATEITRLNNAKEDIRQAIIGKGVDVPTSANIDTYDAYIGQISTGGGTPTYTTPFYIENTSSSTEYVHFTHVNDVSNITVEYSTDKTNWGTLITMSGSTSATEQLPANTRWYLRANANTWGANTSSACKITGCDTVGGNILSLLYGSNFTGSETSFKSTNKYVFCRLFDGNTKLKSAGGLILPAKTLVEGCYYFMFNGCTGLLSAPIFPQAVLAKWCYAGTFQGCTSLVCGAEFLSTNLNGTAFNSTYQGCTNLRYIKILTIGGSTSSKLNFMYMTNNVQPGGVFVQHEDAVWAQNASAIPSGWTITKAEL